MKNRLLLLVWLLHPRGALAEGAAPIFVDITDQTGIDFRHQCGSLEKDYILEVNGSGVALFDYDNDGDLDIYFVNGSSMPAALLGKAGPLARPPARGRLYRNDGGFHFTDVTEPAGVGEEGWGCGAAVADADNDGHLDLFIANLGPDALYLNDGSGAFRKLERSGLEDSRWGSSAAFADFDRDGWVDLYVANYVDFDLDRIKPRGENPGCVYKGVPVFCGPGGLVPAADAFYLNSGRRPSGEFAGFREAASAWGVDQAAPAYGLGAAVVDANRDGWPDVYVANDTMANYLFLNDKGKGFREAALYFGLAFNDRGTAQAGMGIAAGDGRGSGAEDIVVTNFEDDTNTYYRAGADGFFSDETWTSGLGQASYRYLGWGVFFFDADLDGDLDLFVANGHVAPQADQMRSSPGYRQPNQLFLNDGKGRFEDASARAGPGLETVKSSRGAAFGDLDGDGDPDIAISNIDDRPTILENRGLPRNVGEPPNHWIAFRLTGTASNRAAIGARVSIAAGGRMQVRRVQSGGSYASQSELLARFGLGSADKIDSLRVDWPSGRTEEYTPRPVDQVHDLIEGKK